MANPTTRLLIVCTAAVKDLVNAAVNDVDAGSVGDVLNVPLALSDLRSVVVGYWCSWAMDDVTRAALDTAISDAAWLPQATAAERKVYGPGAAVPAWGTQRVWLFEGTYPPQGVLDVLGLALPVLEQ